MAEQDGFELPVPFVFGERGRFLAVFGFSVSADRCG